MARASSVAVTVEQQASQLFPISTDDSSVEEDASESKTCETEGATWVNGEVFLKENPLKTVKEILCGKCGLPRLLFPTDGIGARKPEPGVEYCKKRPFIEKPYHDVYGQTYVPQGPGRGKKKKDMVNPLKPTTTKEGTPTGSQDSPFPSPPPAEGPAKPIQFPHSKCLNCGNFIPIKRMNNHMAKCIGGAGRDSSRTALKKIQNGNGNGSRNGSTPPASRNSTPGPRGTNKRSSPNKRDAGDSLDSDESPQKKKKTTKKTAANKLKAPKMTKSASQHSASNLSFEQKADPSDVEDDDGDDDKDGEYGTVVVEPKKKLKPVKKQPKEAESKKKWLHGKGGAKPILPPPAEPPGAKNAMAKSMSNGKDNESESSQTLSSPN